MSMTKEKAAKQGKGPGRVIKPQATGLTLSISPTKTLFYAEVPQRIVRLSDPEMKPRMDALMKRIEKDPDVGLELMRRAGILTPKGNLTKRYGG
jgi:hypothetical protein